MNYIEVIDKLVGSIRPVGETNKDNDRFENLEDMCEVLEYFIKEVCYIARDNKDAYENSRSRAGKYAEKFLNETIVEIQSNIKP